MFGSVLHATVILGCCIILGQGVEKVVKLVGYKIVATMYSTRTMPDLEACLESCLTNSSYCIGVNYAGTKCVLYKTMRNITEEDSSSTGCGFYVLDRRMGDVDVGNMTEIEQLVYFANYVSTTTIPPPSTTPSTTTTTTTTPIPILPCTTCPDLPLTAAPGAVPGPGGFNTGTGAVANSFVGAGCRQYTVTCNANPNGRSVIIGANMAATQLSVLGPGAKSATLTCNGAGQIEGQTPAGDPVIASSAYCSIENNP